MTSRILIQSCSAAKRHDAGVLPAIERYDGPAFRVLRRARSAGLLTNTYVLIVSAQYGLIEEDWRIADYDALMTRRRALELAPEIWRDLLRWLRNADFLCADVFVNLGVIYMLTVEGLPSLCEQMDIRLTVAHGGIGERQRQLKSWLNGDLVNGGDA